MTELLDRPIGAEAKHPGIVSPELLVAAGIPTDTYQFDYNNYVEGYEARKTADRLDQLSIIGDKADELSRHIDSDDYDQLKRAFDAYVAPINQAWGAEFDEDILNYLSALLIGHKDITFVIEPKTELFWFDRLKSMVNGIPYDQDEHYIDEDGTERQAHPGRPDADKIELRVYTIPDSMVRMRKLALAQSVHLAA